MNRRDVITLLGGAAAAWPLAARAQPVDHVRRVGALIAFAKDDRETEERLAALRQGLAKRGWVEGRNIQMDYRFAAGRSDQFSVLAKELVAMQPDVILGHTPGAPSHYSARPARSPSYRRLHRQQIFQMLAGSGRHPRNVKLPSAPPVFPELRALLSSRVPTASAIHCDA
jgi:hypothetical protein